MSTPVDCLIEASAALTRYRTLTKNMRAPVDDLILYEWLTSMVPDLVIEDTPAQVMRRCIKEGKRLWTYRNEDTHIAQAEMDRTSELLVELGY